MGSFVRLEVKERIAYLSLERPKAYNALSRQVVDELDEALEEIASCGSISVLVIRSRKNFASGADIREMADLTQAEAEKFSFSPTFDKLAEIPIPTVAAIEGYALGGGLELALACDLRIASEDAVLGLPEITLGIMPGAGGTVRLPRIVGEAKAKELIYFLAFAVNLVGDAIYQFRDQVATELRPFRAFGRILYGFDVDTGSGLEIGYAFVTVTIVRRRIFLVHHQAVFFPKSAGQDDIHVTDIIQMDIIHLRDIGYLSI